MMNLSRHGKTSRVANAAATGQTNVNGSSVDMTGFNSVTFYASIGDITATGTATLKAQGSTDDGSSDAWADLKGTAVTLTDAADANKVAILEVNEPRERYIRPVIVRATANSAVDGVVAVQTGPKEEPVTHDTTVGGSEFHHAPAEGTA